MRIIIAIALALALSACGTTGGGVKVPFPDPPEKLMTKPEPLKTFVPKEEVVKIKADDVTPSTVQLSSVAKLVTGNYTQCNLYVEQIFGLQDWILQQKKLNP